MLYVQQPDVWNVLAPLEVAPPNVRLPCLDETHMALTYPVSAAWVRPTPLAWRAEGLSINGVSVNFDDDGSGATLTFDAGDSINVTREGRFYQAIGVLTQNGTVNPIEIEFFAVLRNPAGSLVGYPISANAQTNGTYEGYGPIYIPPGHVLRVKNDTVGNAGQTMNVYAYGFKHTIGTPPPLAGGGRSNG
tara:strand:- start:205 stop:774 length:570 start_codon:yes stop_codon:yes gene_type:complete